MNIEEIIYSNNNILYARHLINIKKFILNNLINNYDISKYKYCIDYFYLNNDINFIDALFNINICKILFKSLNDSNLCSYFNNNQIIISKSIYFFNYNNLDILMYSLSKFNLNYNIIDIKNNLLLNNNIGDSIKCIDKIYNCYLFNNENIHFLSNLYDKFINLSKNNEIQIKKQIKLLSIIFEKINKIVLNENKNYDDINITDLIDSINILSIIKLEIDKIINDKNINNIDYNKSIDELFKSNSTDLIDIFKIFSIDFTSDFDLIVLKNNVKNMINIYNEINNFNIQKIDLIKYIEKLNDEILQLKEIENSHIYNNVESYFIKYFNDINEFINLNDNCDEDFNNVLLEINKLNIELFINLKNDYNYESLLIQLDNETNEKEKLFIRRQIDEINKICNDSFFIKLNEIINYSTQINKFNNDISKINILIDDILKHINILKIQNNENEIIPLNDIKIELEKENLNNYNKINETKIKIDELLLFKFN